MTVPHKPPGYHSVTPYLALRGARAAIDFYARAFGAELVLKLDLPDGTIAHAEIRIGDSVLMLARRTGCSLISGLGCRPVFSLRALMEFAGEGLISFESSRDRPRSRLLFPAVRPVTPSIAHQPAQPISDPHSFGSLIVYAACAA